jgi:hypothetical protein
MAHTKAKASVKKFRWEFESRDEVWRFWLRVREAPRRTDGRTAKQYERYYLGLYLLALAERELLPYPLLVLESESPDFMLTWKSGETTGLEITRATDHELQKWLSRVGNQRPEGCAKGFPSFGYAGDQLEREWCDVVREAIEKKTRMLSEYKPAVRHDVLVSDDTRAGAGGRRKVLALLEPWARELKRADTRLGKISVAASLDVLYDIGGASRIFPYVRWSAPEMDDSGGKESLSERAELAGRVAVERAVREPSERPVPTGGGAAPGYYVDAKGRIIKRTPEGRRFEVRINNEGTEVIVQELPAA